MKNFAFTQIVLVTSVACGPQLPSNDGTESGTGTETSGETVAEDGDGSAEFPDACVSPALIECDELNRCWAHRDGWPAQVQWADPVDIQNGVDAGTLDPIDLGNGAECYALDGADYNPCVIQVECTPLLGRPLLQSNLTASNCAEIGGPWAWVGESADVKCWGLVDGTVVQLKALP